MTIIHVLIYVTTVAGKCHHFFFPNLRVFFLIRIFLIITAKLISAVKLIGRAI